MIIPSVPTALQGFDSVCRSVREASAVERFLERHGCFEAVAEFGECPVGAIAGRLIRFHAAHPRSVAIAETMSRKRLSVCWRCSILSTPYMTPVCSRLLKAAPITFIGQRDDPRGEYQRIVL